MRHKFERSDDVNNCVFFGSAKEISPDQVAPGTDIVLDFLSDVVVVHGYALSFRPIGQYLHGFYEVVVRVVKCVEHHVCGTWSSVLRSGIDRFRLRLLRSEGFHPAVR